MVRGGLFGSVEVCVSSQILASYSSLWAAVTYAVHANVSVMKVYIEKNNYSSLRVWLSRVTRDHEWAYG